MARKKVKLAWIVNDSTRRATFKKRKKGLIKKVQELSTLCDVKMCVVVYGGPQEREAEAWPSVAESQRVLRRFRSLPEMEQSKKMVDQEGFLRQRLAKAQEQLRRLERENREFDTCLLMHDALAGLRALNTITIEDSTALAWLVEMRLRAVQERIHRLRSSPPSLSQNQSQGLILPTVLLPQIPPDVAANAAERSGVPAWYANAGDSIGLGHTDETVSMQPYLDAASAWNDFLHLNS